MSLFMNITNGQFERSLLQSFNMLFGKRMMASFVLILASFFLLNTSAKAQKIDTTAIVNSIFPRGEKSTSNNNFNGGVWVKRYVSPPDSLDCIVALVTFERESEQIGILILVGKF